MSRPESEHTLALRAFRERLVAARREAARSADVDQAARRFIEIATCIGLLDEAIGDEMDLTPIPRVDDPTRPPPSADPAKGPQV